MSQEPMRDHEKMKLFPLREKSDLLEMRRNSLQVCIMELLIRLSLLWD